MEESVYATGGRSKTSPQFLIPGEIRHTVNGRPAEIAWIVGAYEDVVLRRYVLQGAICESAAQCRGCSSS
jgi:hypothetical protein